MTNSTIVAISTPNGIGGISIVRLSGPSAISIADEFFCAKNKTKLKNAQHARMNFGEFDIDGVKEKGYAVVFFAPNSFTGENIVEMQVHGGTLIATKIVEECVACGAKVAGKGDFSKRAFENGKASLDSLEGMIDMIHAESESELRAAARLYAGKLKEEIEKSEDEILEALSGIEVGIDYPDEVDEEPTKSEVFERIESTKNRLKNLLKTKKQGRILRDGVMTLILGKPNVGKSSILNSILGENRAIVTDIAGTTRDIVKETFVFEGVKFQILDTAGIRETSDKIEKIGVERAKENIDKADLVLFVVDGSVEISKEDEQIKKLLKNNAILVLNKTDKKITTSAKQFFEKFVGEKIQISASVGVGIDELLRKMKESCDAGENTLVLSNERHVEAIENATKELEKLNLDMSLDLLAFGLKSVLIELGKISGKTASEEVMSKIFSKFCVGK